MHALLIAILLIIAFPFLARVLGWMISALWAAFVLVFLYYLIQGLTH
jgi:hypothetical protein